MPTQHVTGRRAQPLFPCLLHADFHVMERACWGVTLDWHVAHNHLEACEARDDYEAAVERKMLDQLARSVGGIITP